MQVSRNSVTIAVVSPWTEFIMIADIVQSLRTIPPNVGVQIVMIFKHIKDRLSS